VSLLTRSRDDPDDWLLTWERSGAVDAGPDADAGADESDGEAGDGNDGDGGKDGKPKAAAEQAPAPRRRRRWRAVLVVAFVVVAALTISPVSPFEQAQEHDRVPVGPGGLEPSPRVTAPPPPKPGPTLPTIPGQPPPSAEPAPDEPPSPAPAPADMPTPGPIQGAGYGLAFSDDFDGGSLDQSVWSKGPVGNPLPPSVSDGRMTIRTTAANNHEWGIVSSTGPRRDSEPNYPNAQAWEQGYFEARIRYTDNNWSWPAFWLFSMAKSEAWPGEDCSELNAEWDIMENGVENGEGDQPAGNWYYTNLHRNTTDNTGDGYCGTPDSQRPWSRHFPDVDLSSWHTWAAYWSDDRFCTYMDDVQLQCMDRFDSTSQPMHLVFTMQYLTRCDGCGPRPSELEMQVDWVRVWQEG
jgi:hypothetical protein